jgi:hypothetical protein
VDAEHLGELRAHVPHRVQRRRRLLEDHRDPVAAQLAHVVAGKLQEVLAVEEDLARLHPAGLGHQAHDREAGHALAAAGLPDEAHDLAAVDVEIDAVDGPDDAVPRMERGLEATHLEQRPVATLPPGLAGDGRQDLLDHRLVEGRPEGVVAGSRGAGHRLRRGSSASRRPSPSRLKPRTVSVIAIPGAKIR